MPIWDVTQAGTSTEIGTLWDVSNAGTSTQIGTVYDVDAAGTSSLIYTSETQIYPGTTATIRVIDQYSSAGTAYAVSQPGVYNYGRTSACAYYVITGISTSSYLTMTFTITSSPTYGSVFAGVGNFSSYAATSWPTMTYGYGYGTNIDGGFYSGQVISITIPQSAVFEGMQVGVGSLYTSDVGIGAHIALNSLILY